MSFVKLDREIYYGIHPGIVLPTDKNGNQYHFDNYIILTEDTENKYINYPLPQGNYVYIPIKDITAVNVNKLTKIVDILSELKGTIYIACRGGHGRSAMIAGALYGKKHKKTGEQVLKYILEQWKLQRDQEKIRPFIREYGSPQTTEQKQVIIDFLSRNSTAFF